jgi:hypothetical protein
MGEIWMEQDWECLTGSFLESMNWDEMARVKGLTNLCILMEGGGGDTSEYFEGKILFFSGGEAEDRTRGRNDVTCQRR